MRTDSTAVKFREEALVDQNVKSGNYHATYRGHIDDPECWCMPQREDLTDEKRIYWHKSIPLPKPDSTAKKFADPLLFPPVSNLIEIFSESKDSDGSEYTQV